MRLTELQKNNGKEQIMADKGIVNTSTTKSRKQGSNSKKKGTPLLRIWKARWLYLLALPFMVWLIVFCYGPMYGVLMAFEDYKASLGVLGSEWVGLKHFRRIFIIPAAKRAIANTLVISISRLIFEFPAPIILAVLITEMRGTKLKKVYQTIFTFPHFLSWIVVSAILGNFLSSNGAINVMLANLGIEKMNFLGNVPLFRPMLYATSIWKGVGWSAIIYMAALAGIDPTLYEAADIDGATRLQRIRYVMLPGIKSTIIIMFILAVGGVMDAGFDQIFNMRNAIVTETAQILDTYIYDITFASTPNYGFSTAVGLFKAVINFILLVLANTVVGRMSGERLIQ